MGADEYGKMIIVTKPAGGEIWATGSKHPIKWDKYGVRRREYPFQQRQWQ